MHSTACKVLITLFYTSHQPSCYPLSDPYFSSGLTSKVPEVQELIGELAKKVSATSAIFSPVQLGTALFGLQGNKSVLL